MGVSSFDKSAPHRRLEGEFVALDNALGVALLLKQTHALINRAYAGDTAAIDITLDLRTAIERAGLTRREQEAVKYVYGEDLTQAEAGVAMGIEFNTVGDTLKRAHRKIAEVYEKWAWSDEGYAAYSSVLSEYNSKGENDESDAV
jgi:DNA-directed RNA polymerase specialized sigma24 family protein